MREPPAPDYFEALRAKTRTVRLRLSGEDREIERARFGRHYELIDILYSTREEFEKVISYVATATGIPGDHLYDDEIADAFSELAALNEPTQLPAIVRFQPQKQNGAAQTPPGLKYRGRWLAACVNDLAHHYGWTVEYILDLGPEEALLYLQEIAAQEHRDREFEYTLSDAGRDKKGKQKKFPPMPWASVPYIREKAVGAPPVPDIMRPIGNIIRVDDLVRKNA